MLAFALKTVRKLCCFFPTLHYSCFTLVCAKDIIKQIRYLLLFTIYPFLETRKVLFPHNFTYEHYKLSLIFKSFSFYSSRSLVSYICKFFFFFLHHPDFLPFVPQALILSWGPVLWICKSISGRTKVPHLSCLTLKYTLHPHFWEVPQYSELEVFSN